MHMFDEVHPEMDKGILYKLKTSVNLNYTIPIEFCSVKAKVNFYTEYDSDKHILSFVTRSNGQPSYDQYSTIDYQAAEKLAKEINIKFPMIKTQIETVNEFVNVNCCLKSK